jgi:hypothetical protein
MPTATNQQPALSLQEQVKELLHVRGLLKEIRPLPEKPGRDDRLPIQVDGKPISESIIEARR